MWELITICDYSEKARKVIVKIMKIGREFEKTDFVVRFHYTEKQQEKRDAFKAKMDAKRNKGKLECYLDGDALSVVRKDFVNLQESPAYFISLDDVQMRIINDLIEYDPKFPWSYTCPICKEKIECGSWELVGDLEDQGSCDECKEK